MHTLAVKLIGLVAAGKVDVLTRSVALTTQLLHLQAPQSRSQNLMQLLLGEEGVRISKTVRTGKMVCWRFQEQESQKLELAHTQVVMQGHRMPGSNI